MFVLAVILWVVQIRNHTRAQPVLQMLANFLRDFFNKGYSVVKRLPVTYLEALLSCLCDRDSPLFSWWEHSMSSLSVSSLVNGLSCVIPWYDECSIQTKIRILQDHLTSICLLHFWLSDSVAQGDSKPLSKLMNHAFIMCLLDRPHKGLWHVSTWSFKKKNTTCKMYSISTFCLYGNCNSFRRKSKQNSLWR